MKILYLLYNFPYRLTFGPSIQTFNLLRYISRFHECHVLGFCDEVKGNIEDIHRMIPNIRVLGLFPRKTGLSLQISRIKHLLKLNPLFLARWENESFVQILVNALRNTNYDIVHMEGFQLAPYLNLCSNKPTILSTIDAISLAQSRSVESFFLMRAYRKFSAWCTARFEKKNLLKATKIHVVSKQDCQYLRSLIPELDVEFIEIVVPEELVQCYSSTQSVSRNDEKYRILFTGQLFIGGIAKGLIQFLEKVYPFILSIFPDLQMVILSKSAPKEIRKRLKILPNVIYIPWVDDYYAELAKSDIIIFTDFSGTGIKNRVIKAMALGKAIVGTPIVFEGIPVKDGVHCFIRDLDESFSQAVIALLRNPQLRESIGTSARRLVFDNYLIDVLGPKWLSLYERTIEKFTKVQKDKL